MENQNLILRQRSTGLIATVSDPEKVRELERSLTLEKIVREAVPISVVLQNTEPGDLERTLDIQLTRLVESLNLKWNLSPAQIKTIVEDLIDKYTHESLEDFILVFKRARQGGFGELYRLDSAVIFSWMQTYLDEKYQIVEKNLRNKRDDFESIQFPELSESVAKEVAQFADGLRKPFIPEIPITEKEIRLEGQEKPKKPAYHSPGHEYLSARELHLQWIRENYDLEGNKLPGFKEEAVWIEGQKQI